MGIITDDIDIRDAELEMMLGGNGDYYLTVRETNPDGLTTRNTVRVSTSGGNAPMEVKVAISDLFRAMDKHGLIEDND